MSAERYVVCPKCKAEAESKRTAAMEDAAQKYGKIPAEEWKKLSDAASKKPLKFEQTFAEYYEIGLDHAGTGEFSVRYRGVCYQCGFEHSFDYKKPLKVD